MKELLESPSTESDQALEMFCYQIAKAIGSLTAALGGLDMLIFTSGIGENAHTLREQISNKLAFLNIPEILVVPTNEELMIARHTARIHQQKRAA